MRKGLVFITNMKELHLDWTNRFACTNYNLTTAFTILK